MHPRIRRKRSRSGKWRWVYGMGTCRQKSSLLTNYGIRHLHPIRHCQIRIVPPNRRRDKFRTRLYEFCESSHCDGPPWPCQGKENKDSHRKCSSFGSWQNVQPTDSSRGNINHKYCQEGRTGLDLEKIRS